MTCFEIISTILLCTNCETTTAISHAEGSDPLLKAKLRQLKCTYCNNNKFEIKEL